MNTQVSKLKIFYWTLFDFANTSFSVLIVTVGYSLYFKTVVAGGGGHGDFLWGSGVSISMLLTALISPLLGAISDFTTNRKFFLLIFTLVCVVCTCLMFFVTGGMILLGLLLFIIANIGFEGGIVFYDAFLPDLAEESHIGRVSGYGFAMGYLGAFAALFISMPFLTNGFIESNLPNVRFSFVIAGIMFFVFALPMFFGVHEGHRTPRRESGYIKIGFNRLMGTLSHIKQYKNIGNFLLAFFLYNDAILTVISFASIFAKDTLNFTMNEIVVFFLIVQSTAILGSIVFGIITDKIGPKKTIDITIVLWIIIVVAAYFTSTKFVFYIVGLGAGAAMGSSQAASRSLMALITPVEKKTEFFGFFDGFFGKASAVVGVFIFGLLSQLFNSQRIAILSVIFFFVGGFILLQRVQEHEKTQQPRTV